MGGECTLYSVVMGRGKRRWKRHVERMAESDWVEQVTYLNRVSRIFRVRSKKT